jgi:glycosyltransferase involved in cell wall biosynthesis
MAMIEERPKFILVIGHESSGNRLAANTLAKASGFDYDDGETHLDETGHVKTTYLQHTVQQWWDDPSRIVCDHSRISRRSLPHGGADEGPLRFINHPLIVRHFPQPMILIDGLKKAGFDVYVVITVRDRTVAALSKHREHTEGGMDTAQAELDEAVRLMNEILEQHEQCFLCSYEALMMLGAPYVQLLYRFVGISSDYVPSLRDANPKYYLPAFAKPFGILRESGALTIGVVTRKDDFIWGGDLRALYSVIEGLRRQQVNVVTAKSVEELPACTMAFISNTCDDRRPEMNALKKRNLPYALIGFHEDFVSYYPVSMGFNEYISMILQGLEDNGHVPRVDDLFENPEVVLSYNHAVLKNILYNLPVMRGARYCQAASDTEARTMHRDCPQAKVETVYWNIPLLEAAGGDEEEFLRLTGLKPGEYILQVGRLETRKNQLASVLATRNIDAPLVFIASRGYQSWYELLVVNAAAKYRKAPTLLISQEHPSQHVGNEMRILQMPGGERLSETCLIGAYRYCGLHLHPAFYEAPGYTNLEAAQIGVPTVTSAWGTLRDYCCFDGGDPNMNDRFEYVIPYHLPALEKAVKHNFGRKVDPKLDHPLFRRTVDDVGRETLASIERHL